MGIGQLGSKAALAAALLVAGCGPALVMPPAEFDRPFEGTVIEQPWPLAERPSQVWSQATIYHFKNTGVQIPICLVKIASEVSPTFQNQLRQAEIGNCNGWGIRDGDVNDKRKVVR